MKIQFSDDFVWGVSTASYQIEGGVKEGEEARPYGIASPTSQAAYCTATTEIWLVTVITEYRRILPF